MKWIISACLLGSLTTAMAADRENLVLGLIDEPAVSKAPQPSKIDDIQSTLQEQQAQLDKNQQILTRILAEQAQLDQSRQQLDQRLQQFEANQTAWQQDQQKMQALYVSLQKRQQKQRQQAAKAVKPKPVWRLAGHSQAQYWLKNSQNHIIQAQLGDRVDGYGIFHSIDTNGIATFIKQ